MTLDRSPEDILREEQEREKDSEMPGTLGVEGGRPSLGLPHYNLWEGTRQVTGILNYSYWNCNGMAMCIAAKEGAIADWAAYIGAIPALASSEEDAVDWTVSKGAKLSRQQANRWFPDLPIEAYRE
ncbi:hypothetical protein LCGC14_1053960 [marine sediment metagenome]|uniref:Uncharacterized protein n=1 Tax=marine sediment metagenome TaxID=412755 RepID=A0A0F9N9S9_9ZZZZ